MFVEANKNGMFEFEIPIEWSVYDTVKVRANSLEEALSYVKEDPDDIPLGDDPIYIDGSFNAGAENAEECLIYQDINKVQCLDFYCDPDLSKYVDSMLFESGETIAKGTFAKGTENFEVYLDVRGEVSVTYKDEVYHSPEEFPDELKAIIKDHPNQWFNDDDIYVGLNNWFEYIFEDDGEVFEEDVAKATPEKILEDMMYLANEYFRRKEN